MVKSCCVIGCTSNKRKHPDRRYYIFPKDEQRREKWKAAINRRVLKSDGSVAPEKLWSPESAHTYVCSAHFISGEKHNIQQQPDYVPSIFPNDSSTKTKSSSANLTAKLERFERATNRSCLASVTRPSKVRNKIVFQEPKEPQTPCTSSNPKSLNDTLTASESEFGSANVDVDTKPPPIAPMKKPLDESERELLYEEIHNLRRERDEALTQVKVLQEKLTSGSLCSQSVANNSNACHMLTGLDWDAFQTLCEMLEKFSDCPMIKNSLPKKEQLFLTLVKLRHNMSFELLGHVKGIPKTTLIDYFSKWFDILDSNMMALEPALPSVHRLISSMRAYSKHRRSGGGSTQISKYKERSEQELT